MAATSAMKKHEDIFEVTCILHAYGTGFQPDSFLSGTRFPQEKIIHNGSLRSSSNVRGSADLPITTHLMIAVSKADMLDQQIKDAVEFLERYQGDVKKLRHFNNVEEVCLNFTVEGEEILSRDTVFPSELSHLSLSDGICLNIFNRRECSLPS